MSIEVILFLIVGVIAVVAAVMMLLSQNAVHSALFLILNLGCVAFLFLLLDATFLAMVQIAVYTGAIMVLFLFVIMLLGAERVGTEVRQFRWLSPLALVLAVAFLIAVGLAIIAGEVDQREIPAAQPMVRVAHAASAIDERVDVYLDGQLIAESLEFREATDFETITEGEYELRFAAGESEPQPVGTITLEEGQARTVLVYGSGSPPSVAVFDTDLSIIDGREGRVVFFNALENVPAVDLVDPGSDLTISPDEEVTVLVEDLEFGTATEPALYDAGNVNWAFVRSDESDEIVLTVSDYDVRGNRTQLLVLAEEPSGIDDAMRPMLMPIVTASLVQFGGPQDVGRLLFTEYVLPFEMLAVLLLAAMVGAIVLTQRGEPRPKPGRPMRRRVSRSLTSVIASQTGHDVTEDVPQIEDQTDAEGQPEPAGD